MTAGAPLSPGEMGVRWALRGRGVVWAAEGWRLRLDFGTDSFFPLLFLPRWWPPLCWLAGTWGDRASRKFEFLIW